MGNYIYDYGHLKFTLNIPEYWEKIYNGKPREQLYMNYQKMLNLLRQKVSMDRYVLDIGCNHSIFSTPASMLGYKVVAFEPVLENYQSSVFNMAANGCKDYNVFHLALSDKNEEAEIFIPECFDNASFSKEAAVANMKGKEYRVENVQCVKFDDWILEHPEYSDIGFAKLDVQGFEMNVILGMSEFLKQAKDIYLLVEFENHLLTMGHTYEELEGLILSLGFIKQRDITGGDRLYYKL